MSNATVAKTLTKSTAKDDPFAMTRQHLLRDDAILIEMDGTLQDNYPVEAALSKELEGLSFTCLTTVDCDGRTLLQFVPAY